MRVSVGSGPQGGLQEEQKITLQGKSEIQKSPPSYTPTWMYTGYGPKKSTYTYTHHECPTCSYFLCDGKSTWNLNPTILGPLSCLFGTTLCRPPAHELVCLTNYFLASPLRLFPSQLGTEQNQPRLHNCRSDYLHGGISAKRGAWGICETLKTQADLNTTERDYEA